MSVKKQGIETSRHRGWIIYTFLWLIPLCLLMFRGAGTLYWGPPASDQVNNFYPWRVFVDRWLQQGVLPFWDPHIFSGYPTLETQQMLNLNPIHLLSMLLSPGVGLTAYTAVNTLTAALTMAWGLKQWGRCSWMASSLGAGLYVLSAVFTVRVMAGHVTVVSAMAWWPLAALSVLGIVRSLPASACKGRPLANESDIARLSLRRVWTSPSIRRIIVISALAHAMVCLAGAPQYVVYLFYIDIAVVIAAARRWTWGSSLGILALVWIFALLLSAPQWLPTMWYLPYTGRATTSSAMGGFTLSGINNIALEMLMPFPFGDDINRGHLHFKNVWETATYPGSVALLLSLALILKSGWWLILRIFRRTNTVAPLSPLSCVGLTVFLFGCYMMAGGWLPGFSGFREPQKARALLAFSIAIMSAGAIDGLVRNFWRWRWPLAGAVIIVSTALAISFRIGEPDEFKNLVQSFGFPMDPQATPYYDQVMEDPTAAAELYRRAWLWGCAGIATIALWVLLRRRAPVLALSILFFASIADPFLTHNRAWVARHPWTAAGLPEPVKDYFQPKLSANEGQLPWRVILHSSIINRTHHLAGFYEFHGYDPLMPAYAVGRMLVNGVTSLPGQQREAIRDKLIERIGVRYDTSAWLGTSPMDAAATVIEAPDATLFTVARKVKAELPGNGMFGPALDGTHYVLPESPGPAQMDQIQVAAEFEKNISALAVAAPDTTATSQLLAGETITHLDTGRPDEFGVKATLTKPALIIYKGTWLPGWHVQINGKDHGRALFANNWMCAAIVPAGQHEVVFRYRPVAWWPSWALTLIGLTALLALSLPNAQRGRLKSIFLN